MWRLRPLRGSTACSRVMALPWKAVNESAPSTVARILGIPRSPHGGRKLCCPFCSGRNLAPLKRAFYCYSGCGGKPYSNIDTAARVWRIDPPQACRRLAAALDIPYSGTDVPWNEVSDFGTPEVAAVLNLSKRAAPWFWDCPVCGGEGTLRSYRKRWRCQSRRCSSDEHQGWRGHVDLAAAVWRTNRTDAAFRLRTALRDAVHPAFTQVLLTETIPDGPTARELALSTLLARPGATLPEDLYGHLLGHMRLGELGKAELIRRHLDPAHAERFGFRSVEAGEWRARILPLMRAFTDDELLAAGFPKLQSKSGVDTPWWPGYGRAPLLVIPILDAGRVVGLRLRNLVDPAETRCRRYNSPIEAQPPLPFNAGALGSGAQTVHISEGELNAYTLICEPYSEEAAGQPGASTWQMPWGAAIKDTTRYVVGWFDNDLAGRKGAVRLRDSLALARGFEWAHHRWRLMLVDNDISELHVGGSLPRLMRTRPWTAQDVGPLWADEIELFRPKTAATG